jgi:hypothetical protein
MGFVFGTRSPSVVSRTFGIDLSTTPQGTCSWDLLFSENLMDKRDADRPFTNR